MPTPLETSVATANPRPLTLDVTVGEGKYTVQQDRAGRMWALRHGQPWRDLTGDNLVCALAHEVESLREQLAAKTTPKTGLRGDPS